MLAYTSNLQNRLLTLSCSDGRVLVTNNYDDALAFLLFPTNMGVVWNIDSFVDDLTSLMHQSLQKQIKKGGRVITPGRRKVYYQQSRLFCVNAVNIYGLNRYADEPITDCTKLLELGNKVIEAYKVFGIEATKLTSPIAVYSQVIDNLPFARACDLPDSAFPIMEQSQPVQSREWRDVYQLGHWEGDEISDVDLVAAYPYLISRLPDIRHAKFFTSKAMPEKYSWGVLTGKLKITKPLSPFICEKYKCYGMGEWDDIITSDQLWFLHRYGVGDFLMDYGNFFLLPKTYSYPFKETMEWLYKARDSENEIVSKIAKGISVGIGGKFAERYSDGSLGDNANPIYALMTTSRCMIKVADFIFRNQMEDSIVSILVDGFLATKRLPLANKKAMGRWRINEALPALVLSLEYQWQGSKRPGYVNYEEIVERIRRKPNSSCYGDIDFNLLNYNRHFASLPKTGGDLMSKRYSSTPIRISA